MRDATLAALIVVVAMGLPGCDKQKQTSEQKDAAAKAEAVVGTKQDVLEALAGTSDLSTMATLVKSAGLEKVLGGVGNYTLFAPTDAAFARLPEDQRKLLESKDGRPQLLALLRQHIVTGFIAQADLDKGLARSGGAASLATMGGAPIRLHRGKNGILLGPGDAGPRVVAEPIVSRNGVIYRIDQVIPPPAKYDWLPASDTPDPEGLLEGTAAADTTKSEKGVKFNKIGRIDQCHRVVKPAFAVG